MHEKERNKRKKKGELGWKSSVWQCEWENLYWPIRTNLFFFYVETRWCRHISWAQSISHVKMSVNNICQISQATHSRSLLFLFDECLICVLHWFANFLTNLCIFFEKYCLNFCKKKKQEQNCCRDGIQAHFRLLGNCSQTTKNQSSISAPSKLNFGIIIATEF